MSQNCIEMIPVIPSIYISAPTAQDLFCHFDILGLWASLYCIVYYIVYRNTCCIDNIRSGHTTTTCLDKRYILGTGGGRLSSSLLSSVDVVVVVFVPDNRTVQ